MNRRNFLTTASGIAAGSLFSHALKAQAVAPPVKTVRTQHLEIGYHESGDPNGFPVFLLHGFPDDAHAYDDVAPPLAKAGYRAFAVYLRGYGPTRILDTSKPKMAEQAAIGQDVVDLADALKLPRFAVCGFDWGGRASGVVAALYPERVRAAVLIGGYSIQNTVTPGPPGPPATERRAWYQWYFNTERGRAGLDKNRYELCKLLWDEWSPTWHFSDALYNKTAPSFNNPDFVDCVIHSYRHRNFNAPGEARFLDMEKKLAERPRIEVPTVILHGGDDGFGKPAPEATAAEKAPFTKLIARHVVPGAGHFVPHEKPQAVADAVLEVLAASK